jgi:hypothetical protein
MSYNLFIYIHTYIYIFMCVCAYTSERIIGKVSREQNWKIGTFEKGLDPVYNIREDRWESNEQS